MNLKNIEERIAITVWGHRISPVFDSAQTLLIAEIKDKVLVSTSYRTFSLDHPLELLQILRAEKVRQIICGAVSVEPTDMLLAAGFELISFITGDVHKVLEAFIKGDKLGEYFKMPGCGKNICCRGKIRRGHDISSTNENWGRCRQQQSSQLVAEKGDDNNGSGGIAEISVKTFSKP